MTTTTLAEQTQSAMLAFMAQLPEGDRSILEGAFQRLMESQAGAGAIKVGDSIPDFRLPNASGQDISIRELLKQGPVVLNFYRGGWCPFCNLEFKALHDYLPEMQRYGASLVGISPESPEISQVTIDKHGLKFEVLCDQGNHLAKQFGLVMVVDEAVRPLYEKWGLDIPAANGDDSFELPLLATYVIDSNGKVSAAYINKDYTQRMEPSDIIKALAEL